jgi:uncharacterized protein (DUF2147 family)
MKIMVFVQKTSCALVFSLMSFSVSGAEIIEGVWLNEEGDGWIELRITDGELRGVIAGSPDDPERLRPPRLDEENPDPALRDRDLFGMRILYGFRIETAGRWGGGRVYDPNNGNTYRGTITLANDNTLRLRGFIGLSLFGRTEVWTRRK